MAEKGNISLDIDISSFFGRHRKLSSQHEHVEFSKPQEIGCFSLDSKRKFLNDRTQIAYIEDSCNLHRRMDLSDGFHDRFIKRDDNQKERLDHLLRWVISNLHKFRKSGAGSVNESLGMLPSFILWRGHMTKIMCTPYENQDGWIMAAQKLGSTVYISEVETAEATKKRLDETEKQKLMTYWGVRFEKYMTRPDPPSSSSHTNPVDQLSVRVNTNEAYCTIVRSKLDLFDLIYGAEVDCCVHPDLNLKPPDNYIELKTSREFSARRQEDNFHRYKTKKWWAQSYLSGVPQITCGFRDDNGIVVRITDFKTHDLPRMARSVPGNSWDANVCLQFLRDFFNAVDNTFRKSDDQCIAIFSWNPGDVVISCKIFDAKSGHSFIPEWYISSLKCMQFL